MIFIKDILGKSEENVGRLPFLVGTIYFANLFPKTVIALKRLTLDRKMYVIEKGLIPWLRVTQ